jgi:hypothetical protein
MRRSGFHRLALGAGLLVLVAGCSSGGQGRLPVPGADGVLVGGERQGEARGNPRGGSRGNARGQAAGPRSLRVPPGHYPPPGQCRLWFEGRPPGQQPAPQSCASLRGRVPSGAFVLYNDRAWDSRYDWRDHERRNRGSVPQIILRLF